jgi:hypothetical protein
MWRGRRHVRRRPVHPMAIPHKVHRVLASVPEDGAERFKPLDAQHHLVGGNLRVVAVDGE